jgi:hypothetical protein
MVFKKKKKEDLFKLPTSPAKQTGSMFGGEMTKVPGFDEPDKEEQSSKLKVLGGDSGPRGYVMDDGRTFLGLSKKDQELLAQRELAKRASPVEQMRQEGEQAQALQKQQLQAQQALSGIGLTPEEIAQAQAQGIQGETDYLEAGLSGLASAAPAGLAAAAAGLTASSGVLAATGVGAPIAVGTLAVAGGLYAISKLWGGVQSNLKDQQRDKVTTASASLAAIKTNMRLVATLAESDPQRASDTYDQWLAEAYRAEAKLKRETDTMLERYLDGGDRTLADFDNFLKPGGQAESLKFLILQRARAGVQITPEELNSILGTEE